MNLLFVHDVKSVVFNNEVFARSYGYDIWRERYLQCFDSVRVCFRSKKADSDPNGKIDKSSGEKVTFEDRIGMFKGPEVFFSKKIKSILRENIRSNDAVIVRLDSFLGLQTIRECRKMKRKYMIELVGCAWDSFWNHGISGKILAPYIFIRTKHEIKRAEFVVYVTDKFLQKRYPTNGKSFNISNVRLENSDVSVLEERLKRIDSYSEKKQLTLCTAANVNVKYKGQQFVIEALGLLKKQGITDFRYQLIGSGNNSYLCSVARKNNVEELIDFVGSITHEDVFDKLKNTVDIYIQPSLQEGLPRAIIEAMSVGVPCIGSDVAGIPELLNERYIFNRKKNRAKQIAGMLKGISNDDLKREAKNNFEKSKEYDYKILLERRKNALEEYKKSLI